MFLHHCLKAMCERYMLAGEIYIKRQKTTYEHKGHLVYLKVCFSPYKNANIASLPQANIFKHVTSLSETQIHRMSLCPNHPPDTMGLEQMVQRCVIRDNVCLHCEIPTVTATFVGAIARSQSLRM